MTSLDLFDGGSMVSCAQLGGGAIYRSCVYWMCGTRLWDPFFRPQLMRYGRIFRLCALAISDHSIMCAENRWKMAVLMLREKSRNAMTYTPFGAQLVRNARISRLGYPERCRPNQKARIASVYLMVVFQLMTALES